MEQSLVDAEKALKTQKLTREIQRMKAGEMKLKEAVQLCIRTGFFVCYQSCPSVATQHQNLRQGRCCHERKAVSSFARIKSC